MVRSKKLYIKLKVMKKKLNEKIIILRAELTFVKINRILFLILKVEISNRFFNKQTYNKICTVVSRY